MKINAINIIDILIKNYNYENNNSARTATNAKEFELAQNIIDLIDRCKQAAYTDVETFQELVFDGNSGHSKFTSFDYDDENELQEPTTSSSIATVDEKSSTSPDDNPEEKEKENVDLEYKQKAVNFWKSGKKGRLAFKTVQKRYRKLSTVGQLYRWEKHVNIGGSRINKLKLLAQKTIARFIEMRNRKIPIHDIDLRRWALQENEIVNLPGFQASYHWVWNIKHKYNIVSRKITKLVTRNYTNNLSEINAAADNFVQHVKQHFEFYGKENIFNTDQSGFHALSWKGENQTESAVQSVSSMTHSYTIQPTVSADGKLQSPLFLVLKETGGQLGPRVQQTTFTAPNIVIGASSSGKLTKELLKIWLEKAFLPIIKERAILILDSWSGYDENLI
nr:PREDICTED: uncharacterized protein LOC105663441 [Megachile rotundata]XP_012147707.1 PREDICTED: uncharacterized protein LOC105663441 [Megachile rotundata]